MAEDSPRLAAWLELKAVVYADQVEAREKLLHEWKRRWVAECTSAHELSPAQADQFDGGRYARASAERTVRADIGRAVACLARVEREERPDGGVVTRGGLLVIRSRPADEKSDTPPSHQPESP